MLKTDKTFTLSHVNRKKEYARTEHVCQLVLEESSTIVPLNIQPFAPLECSTYCIIKFCISSGKGLKFLHQRLSFQTRLRDNTGVIQYSLMGNAIKNCNFGVNNVLILKNVTLKIFGALHVLMGSTSKRKKNPKDMDEYRCYLQTQHCVWKYLLTEKKPERKMLLEISPEPGSRSEVESKVVRCT